MSSRRIELLDAARGLCVILMIIYHAAFDLITFMNVPQGLIYNPLVRSLEYFFAGMFILISGISSRFSRSNVKRGIKVFIAAIALTIVTFLFHMAILFGILHFLGFSMIFYGLTSKFWDKINVRTAPFLYILLLFGSVLILNLLNPVKVGWLWFIGLWTNSFYSADYFPIFPWIFVFLFGTWLGKVIKDGKFPYRFYTYNLPFLPQIGRKSFIIYLLHQPVILGLIMGLKWLFRI